MQSTTPGANPLNPKNKNNIYMQESDGKNKPYCSVIIPFYNSASTIVLCLESISRLNYPKEKLEIILIDNGSTDESADIANSYGVTITSEKSVKSSYAARNKGIRMAQGDLIAFTDSDCIVTPEWLNHLTSEWKNGKYGCFAGEIEAYQPQSLVELFSERAGFLRQSDTLKNPYMPYAKTANAAYRKDVFDHIGLFLPEMTSGGDADIAWRMQNNLSLHIKYIPEALVYHKHRTSIQGLYNQFIKYEYGRYYLKKYYPDYPLPTVRERIKELENSIIQYSIQLRKSTLSLVNENIDFLSFATPFFEMILCAGTLKARMEIEKSLNNQVDIKFEDKNISKIKADLESDLNLDTMTMREMEALIAQRDKFISSIINSKSWKITAPLRKIAQIFKNDHL